MRHGAGAGTVLRRPLLRAGRTLRQFPFVIEQIFEEVVAPLRRRLGPGDFQTAGDRVTAFAGAEGVFPTQALRFQAGRFRLRPHVGGRTGAMCFAEGVTAGNQRHGLLVVHGHAREGLADIPRRGNRIGGPIRAFRVDVDQPHLDRSERIFENARGG